MSRFNGGLRERLRRYGRNDVRLSKAFGQPSAATPGDLRALLLDELTSIGASDVMLTSEGAVLATVPASAEASVPTIGFLVALQGPDDSAGAAIVLTVAEYLLHDADLRHGSIRMAFAPDEEIGCGLHRHLPDDLDGEVIYTFKGGERRPRPSRPFSPRQNIPAVEEWNRVQDAARTAELCVDAVQLVDWSGFQERGSLEPRHGR